MNPLPLLLSLLLAAPLAAQEPPPLSPKQDKPGWYRTSREFREADVIRRQSFPHDYSLDGKAKFLYCMIPPGADWALDSADEGVEGQYLRLVAAATHLDAISLHDKDEGTPNDDRKLSADPEQRFIERGTGVVGFCGGLRSPTPRVDLARVDSAWMSVCQNPVQAPQIGRYACTAPRGGTVFPPRLVVIQSLKALARSPRPKTAVFALGLMEEIKNREAYFAKTVSEVLLDPKTPLAARERAAEILASVHTRDLSGHTLATVWGDKANPESLRRAALRGYSLVMSFGDPRTNGTGPAPKDAIRDRLQRYLQPLAGVIQAETFEDKNGKDRKTPLGEEALCVAQQYSKRWICYANRFGADWHARLKKDEAAGADACAADGKLK